MFNECEFIIGKDKSLVVVVPQSVPKGEAITIRVVDQTLFFYKSDESLFGRVTCECAKTLRCLRKKKRVGLIEALGGAIKFPVYIAAIAQIQMDTTAYNAYSRDAA